MILRFVHVSMSWIRLVRDFENPVDFFFLKMLLSVLLLKRKTRLGERSSSALLHFAAGGGHPLSWEVFHSGSLSVRELPQPTLLPKPPNDSYYAKGPCYPLGVSHGTVLIMHNSWFLFESDLRRNMNVTVRYKMVCC